MLTVFSKGGYTLRSPVVILQLPMTVQNHEFQNSPTASVRAWISLASGNRVRKLLTLLDSMCRRLVILSASCAYAYI